MWPDNAAAIKLFLRLQTQWRMGPGGPVGLDYRVLPLAMRAEHMNTHDLSDVLDDLQVMELAALDEILGRIKNG